MKKTSFNDFEFIRTLGKGAFCTVYLVRRKINQKQYALKSIIMEKLKENEQQNNVNEIRILSSISHPNVIGYKEAFFNDKNQTLNIVMEYCDDGDLETKIKNMKRNKQKFEESLIWNYALQILGGLKALHDKKILHRDLKSANIFLSKKNNQCKIGDLNVSTVMKDKNLINSQTGTPPYSSPEVWKNKPYSYKSDLWSVGCIIYEMCCLRLPFKGKNLDELSENICSGKFEKISSRYSNDLWKLIKMLLEVDVNKRVDCNYLLNSDFIKDKFNEISDIYNDDNDKNILKFDDDSSMIEPIEYKNLRDLGNRIPNKKKYTRITKNLNITKKDKDRKENKNLLDEETISNDCSFDEFSISENKPINNINKNYTYFNNNNIIFARNNKIKKINNDIIRNFKNNYFNNSLFIHKRINSSIILTFDNIFIDVYLNENENGFKLKKNKSEQKINNNKIIDGFIRTDYIKYFERTRNKSLKNCINKNNKNNFNLLPQNNIVKSGLMNLKKDIAKKISQENLQINTYIKKPSDDPIALHKVSNSNPKYMKQKKNITENNSSKEVKLNGSFIKKNVKHSLFEPIENDKKEKSKFHNQNQKKTDTLDNYNKIKSGELSKFTEQNKKNNKLKKIGILKKNKININDIELLDSKNRSDKNVVKNINKEISNENLIKNKTKIGNNKNVVFRENNNNLHNNIIKTEILNDENPQKVIILSDKLVNNHKKSLENVNNKSKNKKIKSNKSINKNKSNSRIIEIDISNNTNTLKKTYIDLKNPFNDELKNNNKKIMLKTSQDFKNEQLLNQNKRFSTKGNNIKSITNKILKVGDN